jgi:hypothetical protein
MQRANMKLEKEAKPYYITVVCHFTMGHVNDAQAFIAEKFKEFDDMVNAKVAEGYMPHGSFIMDHCDTASMDLAQAMVLEPTK